MSPSEGQGLPRPVPLTPVPDGLLGTLLAEIQDVDELKCTLRVVWLVKRQKGFPRYVTLGQLEGDRLLQQGLAHLGKAREMVREGVRKAVARGTLLALVVLGPEGGDEQAFVLNDEEGRRVMERAREGVIALTAAGKAEPLREVPAEKANIFKLYEENIGILTPLVAEELKMAEEQYPWQWIEDAFKEAAVHNKRSWRYIARILERWAAEGRTDGKPGRHTETADPKGYARRWQRFLRN